MSEPIKKPIQSPGSYAPKDKPEILNMAKASAYATDTIVDPYMGGEPPRTSNRILNYRRIQNWENYFLTSAICSVAKAVDEEAFNNIGKENGNDAFSLFSAITGDMFTVLYASDKPCDSGVTNYFFVPQVVKKAYAAFGYECIYISNTQIQKNYRIVMNAIKSSVDKGIPVLAWGMGTLPEACLIGGYDVNDLLYVNLYLGPERTTVDSDGYTAITQELNTTKGLFFLGNPIEKPDMREVYRKVIEGISVFMTMPPADGYVFGKEAFIKWADTLLDENFIIGKIDDELSGVCWNIHCSPYCNICTSAAEKFIKAAAEVYDISIAKKLLPVYQRFIQLRQDIWTLHGDFFPPMDKFRSRDFRAQIADILYKMGSVCDEILMAFEE